MNGIRFKISLIDDKPFVNHCDWEKTIFNSAVVVSNRDGSKPLIALKNPPQNGFHQIPSQRWRISVFVLVLLLFTVDTGHSRRIKYDNCIHGLIEKKE